MLTYQDFLQADNKENFIYNAILEYKASEKYTQIQTSYRYFYGQNDILNRLKWFYDSSGAKKEDRFKINNKVSDEFYKKIVLQENSYLLSNGVTLDDERIKEDLGKDKFDFTLQQIGLNSLLGGICFIYPYIKHSKFTTRIFTALESFALYDEYTAEIKALIRWWQLDTDKPLNIEFFRETELINYVSVNGSVSEVKRTPYLTKIIEDITGIRESNVITWGQLPIIASYSPTKEPILTRALKSKIDLYDIIISDFGNNLEDAQDIYWILKNYAGQDIGEFLADYKEYKVIKVDDEGGAEAKTLEVPHEARKAALDILKKQIYEDSMALDMQTVTGGSLTNVAIKAAMIDLDLKTDLFEWEMIRTTEAIINFLLQYQNQKEKIIDIKFIRRNIVNDTEIIENILKCRSDLSLRTALELNPYIEDVNKVIKEIEEEDLPPLREKEEAPEDKEEEKAESEEENNNQEE